MQIQDSHFPGPYNAPFRQLGIVSFGLVLMVAAYTLRRRFVRVLFWHVVSTVAQIL